MAGLVCSAIGESAIYLLGATNESGLKVKASYLLQWNMIQLLKEGRIRFYDLGGIDPVANPGVYHFKSGFSGVDVSHITPVSVCDNPVSAGMVKTGQFLRRRLRSVQRRLARYGTMGQSDEQPRSVGESISRLVAYIRRHGFWANLRRVGLFLPRVFSSNRMVLFYYDFPSKETPRSSINLPGHLSVERKQRREEMAPGDWEQIVNFWNPDLCERSFTERFQEGASCG